MYQSEHKFIKNASKTTEKAVGIQIVKASTMTKPALRNLLLLVGIMVALVVVIIFNATLFRANTAQMEQPVNTFNELINYAVPNVIIHLF